MEKLLQLQQKQADVPFVFVAAVKNAADEKAELT